MKRVAYENNAGGIVSELNKKTQEYNLKDFKFKGSITATPKKLTDVIDNDKLFAANPALKDVMILYVNIGNLQGAVSSDLKYIYIYISPTQSVEEQKKTIKHELTHVIQGGKTELPTSVYMGVNNGFVDYLADPAEVLARSIETGETIPEIFNDVFKLREQNLSDKMGKITPLRVIRISQVKGFKILPGGKDVCIEGWQQRRLMGDLKPDDPKFVKVEEKYIRLYFANGGNGIIAADILKKKGIAGASSVEVSTTDIPATARNIKKLIKMGMFAQFPKNDTGKRITQNIY